MTSPCSRLATSTALSLLMSLGLTSVAKAQDLVETAAEETLLDTIVISAETQTKQSLGVSNITATDLEETPVVNDISEIVRKMPGVNLSGNTSTGQRGNNRQIDIRGMGPENTLILIDGKPVMARNSVRMGRMGERDTRGDSNWVAPELIERIEVIRGPAAARYGSGAAGGVVNIITKRPDTATGQVAVRYNAPQSSDEGDTKRVNLMYAMPLTPNLHARFNANWNRTEADALDINADAAVEAGKTEATVPAGREGVKNVDFNALLTWAPTDSQSVDFEFGFSRQGNIYAGDCQLSNCSTNEIVQDLYGEETNKTYRQTFGVTHRGQYGNVESFGYLQYEKTRNTRLPEGAGGSSEGRINGEDFATITLDTVSGKSEWILPGQIAGKSLALTLGADLRYESMDDGVSNSLSVPGQIPGTVTDADSRDPTTDQTLIGLYAEANIAWSDDLTLTPALRLDHADTFGDNISPSLNATWQVNENWQVKGGIVRAFKAPNLYQLNPNYVYSSMGNGCTTDYDSSVAAKRCYVVGNPDLKPETSVNTEIGVAFDGLNGTTATFTAFHNDFRNYIMGGLTEVGQFLATDTGLYNRYYKWENVPRAKISGLEASFATDLREDLNLAINATYMIQSKNETTGDPLSLIPKYTINAALDWKVNEQFTVTPSASFYGKTKARTYSWNTDDSVDDPDTALDELAPRDPYAIANINLTYRFNNGATLIGGITNLFDERLERTGAGANTYNEPGRAFYVGLTKTF